MTDPVFKAAADLKKEIADLNNTEVTAIMDEIMKLLLENTHQVEPARKKS